ncbi:hypothetical protein [Sporosarcina jiandibaonis]|nr:hypothetical protein [Sporosarcina jiandibaonis]
MAGIIGGIGDLAIRLGNYFIQTDRRRLLGLTRSSHLIYWRPY